MTQLELTGSDLKQKKRSVSSVSQSRTHRSRKRGALPEEKVAAVEPLLEESVGPLERTKRLLLAALRVWELKRRIRD